MREKDNSEARDQFLIDDGPVKRLLALETGDERLNKVRIKTIR